MEQWDKNYYITSVAGTANGSALVVMSKGKESLIKTLFFSHLSWCGLEIYILFLINFVQKVLLSNSMICLKLALLLLLLKGLLIHNNPTKLVMYFLSNGSIRSGKKASLLPL